VAAGPLLCPQLHSAEERIRTSIVQVWRAVLLSLYWCGVLCCCHFNGVPCCAGVTVQVGNLRVEPPGLFRGRGEHPKVGTVHSSVYILNLFFPVPITVPSTTPFACSHARATFRKLTPNHHS